MFPPLWGLGLWLMFLHSFYTDAEEIPQQINPTGLKSDLGYTKFVPKTRRGLKPRLPDLGTEAIIFLKFTPMVRFCGVLVQMRSAFLTAPDPQQKGANPDNSLKLNDPAHLSIKS